MLRERSGMTLEDVSKIVKVSKQTVQKYESGVVQSIPTDKIELLAKAYDVSPGYIMGWLDEYPDGVPLSSREKSTPENGDLMALREQLRRQPGMRVLFDASKNATEQDLLDAAALLEGFKKRRDGDE